MKDSKNESYTVMILPSPISRTYRFSISKKVVKILLGVTACMTVALVVFMVQYAQILSEAWELKHLRKETKQQKVQIQSFASMIDDLKKQMAKLKDLDTKLRVITNISPPPQSAQMMGIGGREEPTFSELYPVGTSSMDSQEQLLLQRMEQDLKVLKVETSRQELSFQELTEAMKDQRSLWAATPSVWPVRGWLASGFGNRVSPFTGRVAMHDGLDIAAPSGTPIAAPASGLVTYAGFDNGLGKMIKIDHGYGMQTMYGHLSKIEARIGQKVKRGDVIGMVGSTGLSTGPHVHYEVHVNSVAVNPLRYILD
jgi:murein DD-endopeptidase MepM/ murein hydrolase activator NlpD